MTRKQHALVGRRVQIPAYTELWMQGARFGTITRVTLGKGSYLDPKDPRGADIFTVRMDHPQVKRLVRVIADDCTLTEEQIT